MELVSIIITTHNREKLLKRAILSAINQTYQYIEIIIVDDGSSDNTREIVLDFCKKFNNIKYIKHDIPKGANCARNTGIKIAKGVFIAGLDDDDEFIPNRIDVLIKEYSDEYSLITSRNVKITRQKTVLTKFQSIITLNKMLQYNVVGNQVLVKRNRIIEAGLFDQTMKRYQDYDMWLRIIQKFGPGKMIKDVTQIIHTEHEETSNNNLKNNLNGALYFYSKHKVYMNKTQRKVQLFKILRLQERKISLKKLTLLICFPNLKSFLKYKLRG
ncbi:glycosyltransferase [Sunxiuqinia elliptica]